MPLLDGLLGSSVQADGVALPQRGALNFIGARVTDSPTATVVDLTGQGPADTITEDGTPTVLYSLPIAAVGITVYEVTICAYDEQPRAIVWGPFTLSAALNAGVARLTSGSITADIPEVTDTEVSTASFALTPSGTNIDVVGTGFADIITWVVRARKLI